MTGGGSLLHGKEVISRVTGLPVRLAENALNCIAVGAGRVLEDSEFRDVLQATYQLTFRMGRKPIVRFCGTCLSKWTVSFRALSVILTAAG